MWLTSLRRILRYPLVDAAPDLDQGPARLANEMGPLTGFPVI
jgi:hypothetical protein